MWWYYVIKHIISEYCKLVPKEYYTRRDCAGKVIHWKLWKKFKFDSTDKWYMHNPGSLQENEKQNLFLGFWRTNISPIPGMKTRPSDSYKKKQQLTLSSRWSTEWKSKKAKWDMWLFSAWDIKKTTTKKHKKKQWNMNVMVKLIVVGAITKIP